MARMIPVVIPGSAARSDTLVTIFQTGAPNASAASRSVEGTSRSISSVVRVTIGSIRMASATPPANPLKWPSGLTSSP